VLSEEKMIPYGQFFNNNAHNCTVRKQDILSAINRVMVFDNRFYWVDFYFVENGIEIKYADHDLNQYYETKIPSTHSVSFQKITFNAAQLKNVISVLADDDVLIYFDNPKSFINIQSEDKSIELILVPIEPSQLK
jgi:DNA polymerase III sliding clamp (beta) subunit (PCNA family)